MILKLIAGSWYHTSSLPYVSVRLRDDRVGLKSVLSFLVLVATCGNAWAIPGPPPPPPPPVIRLTVTVDEDMKSAVTLDLPFQKGTLVLCETAATVDSCEGAASDSVAFGSPVKNTLITLASDIDANEDIGAVDNPADLDVNLPVEPFLFRSELDIVTNGYTPSPGDPGYVGLVPGGGLGGGDAVFIVTYKILSDVPEPSTLVLFGSGVFALVLARMLGKRLRQDILSEKGVKSLV